MATEAQTESHLYGIIPEETDACFLAQHLSAYAFARPYARGKRVLELGFGEGYGSAYLAEVAAEVTGIDVAQANIARASAKYPRPNLRFTQMDATSLSFANASFGLVCSFQVIEHVPEPLLGRYLAEIARVLQPGGLFCVSTLNLAHNMKPGQSYEKLACHEKEFTAPELKALLDSAFSLVDLYGLHPTRTHGVFQRLKRWGLDRWGPQHLNPVAHFYQRISVKDFIVTRDVSRSARDMIGLCRATPTAH